MYYGTLAPRLGCPKHVTLIVTGNTDLVLSANIGVADSDLLKYRFYLFVQICDDFKEIAYKLRERSNTIEDLTEQREYIKTVPELVNGFQAQIDQAMGDYDLIDEYFYPLSDDDFNNRYVCIIINVCSYGVNSVCM